MAGSIFEYADLVLAALNAAVVVVIVVQVRRLEIRASAPVIALVVFFLLRVASRLNDAPQMHAAHRSTFEQIFDVLSIAIVVYLFTLVRRIVTALRAQQDAARIRTEEYERARMHYTQVVRHRTMNPITVISGTLQTLRDGPELDEPTRRRLCDSAMEAAQELLDVVLVPERRDALEHEFDAQPRLADVEYRTD